MTGLVGDHKKMITEIRRKKTDMSSIVDLLLASSQNLSQNNPEKISNFKTRP